MILKTTASFIVSGGWGHVNIFHTLSHLLHRLVVVVLGCVSVFASDGWLIMCSQCWQHADGSPSCFSFIICSWWEVSAGMPISCYKLVLCQKLVSPRKHVSHLVCPWYLFPLYFVSALLLRYHNHKQGILFSLIQLFKENRWKWIRPWMSYTLDVWILRFMHFFNGRSDFCSVMFSCLHTFTIL